MSNKLVERKWEKRCPHCMELNSAGVDIQQWRCRYCHKEYWGNGHPTEHTIKSLAAEIRELKKQERLQKSVA